MRKITKEKLKKILELHALWLENNNTGKQADLSPINLSGIDLSCVNLSYAKLEYSDLSGVCLWGSYLIGSNLRGANLMGADLRDADLSNTNLSRVNLSYANLEYSDLSGADLTGSDLSGADLTGSDLTGADLTGADLTGADLSRVNLSNTNLTGATLYYTTLIGVQNIHMAITNEETKFLNNQCPKEGEFIGWKKCDNLLYNNNGFWTDREEYIVKLLIPSDAKRSSATSHKCRCSKATVLSIYNMNGKEVEDKDFEVFSQHDREFKYNVGQTVTPNSFDEDWWNECSNGIHFFIERESAEKY